MNFALLGDHPDVLPLLPALAAHSQFALTVSVGVEEEIVQAQLLEQFPGVRLQDDWEGLLLDDGLQGVILASSSDRLTAAARNLAEAGKAVLLLPDFEQGLGLIYELSLARDDSGVTLFPAFPVRVEPLVERLAGLIAAGTLGDVQHLRLERTLRTADSVSGGEPLLSPLDVQRELPGDVDLLRSLGGNYDQVTALQPGRTERGLPMALVTLAGDRLPEATWSLRPSREESTWRLTVSGSAGTAVLFGETGPRELIWSGAAGGENVERRPPDFSPAPALVDRFEAALTGQVVHPDWTDVTRAFEIVDACGRSLKRRRTIDLYFEATSERSQFKTNMTAVGCGLLTLTLFGVVAVLMLGTMFDPKEMSDAARLLMHIARVVVFLPLFLFLLLQVLVFVARPAQRADRTSPQRDRPDDAAE